MVGPKKILLAVFSLLVVVGLTFPNPSLAFQKQYFDYGPYYGAPSVLGFSFSSLEKLPALKIPDNLIPPTSSGILPDSPFYPFEKLVENVQLTFTFDPLEKEKTRLNIAAERLAEAKTLMDQDKTGAASQAIYDYGKSLEALAQNMPAIAQRNDPKSQDLLNQIEKMTSAQTVAASALSLTSAPAQAENWTEAASSAREVLDKIAQSYGEPAIPPTLTTGIQQLKEEGLLSEEESNKLYSLKTRSEVREELNKLASSGQLPPSEIAKLDTSVAKYYPDVQKQEIANWQIVELRGYQALPQPNDKIVEELEKWQGNPGISPSNDIKPYLWHNRASDLAKEVDLSGFSAQEQAEVAKSYPAITADNPTYSPPPSPSPSPSLSPSPAQDSTPSPSPTSQPASPSPTPTSVPARPYLEGSNGALPGQPTYILKQTGETLSLAFTFDPAEKIRLKVKQAERRLAEAEKLSHDPKKGALYESTLKTYRQTLADASNSIKKLPEGKAAKKAAQALEAQAARHEVVFEKGLLPPPVRDPKLIIELIKTTEDAMDKSADALDRPALPPALSSRLGDLKAQGLILAEEANDLVNSSSREDARSKIRKLLKLQTFPLADAKKLDEAQSLVSPSDYNQLSEVRKVEELQNLRSIQTDLAQTPTLKSQATTLAQKEAALTASFDPGLIKPEDLAGKENLKRTYEKLASLPRPVNNGQFGTEVIPGAKSEAATPTRQDAVLSACPEGATFKQFEGCVWADSGKSLNDYDQYKCEGPRQYYSFAAKKCVAYDPAKGYQEDAQPICPVGYQWSWQNQSCQAFTGGTLPLPSPSAEPEPKDEKEIEERSKRCAQGSSYKAPQGCVWDKDGKPVSDPSQYRCGGRGQYYSFENQKCVDAPSQGEPYPDDATPACKEQGAYWSWSEGKCVTPAEPLNQNQAKVDLKPTFAAPDSPLYFLKQAGEAVQQTLAFTPQAKGQVRLAQAKERLAEASYAIEKDDEAGVKKALSSYTTLMQNAVGDLSKAKLSEEAKKEAGKNLSEQAVEHNLFLQKLSALAPQTQDTAINAAVSATILGVDKAADIAGEPPIPSEVKSKIEALPQEMVKEEDKKTLLGINSRVEARLKLADLTANGVLTQTDTSFLREDFDGVDQAAKIKVEELKKLADIAEASEGKDKIEEKVKKNENIAQKLQEFEKSFEAGKDIPAEIRPYVKLTRINEVAQTIRPDIVRLEDFQNRKDVLLAVATLQEEFKPTFDTFQQVAQFRRRNPGSPLPPDLARVEALSFSLGVRQQAGACFLPSPPFSPNTPCPAAGAAIPIASYAGYAVNPSYIGGLGSGGPNTGGYGNVGAPSLDKDGKPLVYGQGPKPASAGSCPQGYHWMYDSGGWCMSDSGSYSSSYSYTPTGTGSGYTPYSSYYNAPGAPPATYGYPVGDNSLSDGCPYGYDSDGRGNCIPNSYPASSYQYSAPVYWGSAPTNYTTTPPSGTVPGSGPKPTAPGQCPSGFHWMSDSGGWCMADGPTYVPPGGQPYSSYPAAGTTTSGTPWCWAASPPPGGWNCGSGSSWDSSTCSCRPSGSTSDSGSGGGYSTSSSYQYGCTPGYYWNGSNCVAGNYSGAGWSDTAARSQSWCQPPSGGCGSNTYWDYGSCYCRSSSTYSGGSGPSPSNQCQGLSCGGGAWLDYSTCSCKYSGGSGTSSTGSTITCYPPSAGCPGGWYDYGTCSCKYSSSGTSSEGCSNVSASSCGSGWYFDSAACTCRQSSTTSGSGGGGSSGVSSCPTGYHPMDNNTWCMQDGGGGGSTAPSPTPAPSTVPQSTPTPESTTQPQSTPQPEQQSTPQPEQQQQSTPQPESSPNP